MQSCPGGDCRRVERIKLVKNGRVFIQTHDMEESGFREHGGGGERGEDRERGTAGKRGMTQGSRNSSCRNFSLKPRMGLEMIPKIRIKVTESGGDVTRGKALGRKRLC